MFKVEQILSHRNREITPANNLLAESEQLDTNLPKDFSVSSKMTSEKSFG